MSEGGGLRAQLNGIRDGTCVITKLEGGILIGSSIRIAADPFSRLRGLLFRRCLEAGEGMLFMPSGAIHTIGMRFSMDVISICGRGKVNGIRSRLRPCRFAIFPLRSAAVLELPEGTVNRCRIAVGDQLIIGRSSTGKEGQCSPASA